MPLSAYTSGTPDLLMAVIEEVPEEDVARALELALRARYRGHAVSVERCEAEEVNAVSDLEALAALDLDDVQGAQEIA